MMYFRAKGSSTAIVVSRFPFPAVGATERARERPTTFPSPGGRGTQGEGFRGRSYGLVRQRRRLIPL